MNPRRRSTAFTLIELLVAVAITAILAAIMLALTTGILRSWARTQDRFTTDSEAALALGYLERDLEAALFRPDGNTWLAVDVINTPATLANHGWLAAGITKPAGAESQRYVPVNDDGTALPLSAARFGLSGAWLRFFTTNVEAGASLPVAVSYQIARRPVSGSVTSANPAAIRYSLFRSAVASGTTFLVGYDILSGYGSPGASPPAQRSAGTITNPNTAGDLLATNVVDFGVWLHAQDATGTLTRIFPVDAADSTHTAATRAEFPLVVDVMVRVLTESGATLIANLESGDGVVVRPANFASDAEWWWATVEANSRVYVRRVRVRSAGL